MGGRPPIKLISNERRINMGKRLYIAYGSNLNLQQMNYRCPTATVVGKSELTGYKLIFKGAPTNAYATIEENEGSTVPVLVWDIKPQDEHNLDRYEGYPTFYYKKNLVIEVEGTEVEAMVYIINKKAEIGIPSQRYYNTISIGYETAGFDVTFLEEALKFSKAQIV